jgi:hypothetical protein
MEALDPHSDAFFDDSPSEQYLDDLRQDRPPVDQIATPVTDDAWPDLIVAVLVDPGDLQRRFEEVMDQAEEWLEADSLSVERDGTACRITPA